MRRPKWYLAVLAAAALVATVLVAPVSARPDLVPGQPVYLALGDSWAWGQGPADPATEGYVPQLQQELRVDLDCSPARSAKAKDGCKHLQLLNLGRPGTDEMPGVTAPIIANEQLPIALPLLEARNHDRNPRNDVELVTLHVGGNDVSGPIQLACLGGFTPECVGTIISEMAAFDADLRDVVGPLRTAAGPDTPIVLGTYDNPVPYCFLAEVPGAIELGALLLEGTPDGSLDGIHDVIRRVAADYDAEVAEVFGQFEGADFVGGGDCLHPSSTGHDKVTEAFSSILGN